MVRASVWVSFLLVATIACDKTTNTSPTPMPSSGPAPGGSAIASIADASTTTAAPDSSDGASHHAWIDLLHATPAQIGVSSAVDNPKDKPDHLVDGSVSTAWNSKTGDLAGAWIGFRVPEDAFVDHLEIVVGFDRVLGDVDLFTANHRIKRARWRRVEPYVTRCDASYELAGGTDATFDTSIRTFQSIPVSQPGGVYCLWIDETLAGSKPTWRETVVSELRVMGTPGATIRDPKEPMELAVGAIPPPFVGGPNRATFAEGAETDLSSVDFDEAFEKRAYKSLGDLCSAYVTFWHKQAVAAKQSSYPPDIPSVACREIPLPAQLTLGTPFTSVHAIEGKNGWSAVRELVLQTADGYWFTPLVYSDIYYTEDDSREHWERRDVESIRVENGQLVMVHDWLYVSSSPIEFRVEPVLVRSASWCGAKTDPSGAKHVACSQWHPDNAAPLAIKSRAGSRDAAAIEALPWQEEISFVVDAQGKLHRTTR